MSEDPMTKLLSRRPAAKARLGEPRPSRQG